MFSYLDLIKDILNKGVEKPDRTGTGTLSVFARQLRFDLSAGFPIVTTKKLHLKSVIYELLWFLNGETNIKFLKNNGVSIWDEWADDNGELGDVYGKQWRSWGTKEGATIDQINNVLEQIKSQPYSRRLLVSAWNVAYIDNMALPPCHYSFQFYIANKKLSCIFNMRSVDVFLGLPFNIASYALLTHMIAQQCGLEVGELIFSGGDVHLYNNHIEQAKIQIQRKPFESPSLKIARLPDDIYSYQYEDFSLKGYKCHPHIVAKISV